MTGVTWSWAFLVVSLVGLWFTANALWPARRWQLLGLSFFAGWLTGELAMWHVAWQAVATIVFVGMGALDAWPGWVGLAITLVSWLGLAWLIAVSLKSRHVVEDALRAGLGEQYRDEIDEGFAHRLATRNVRRQIALPLLLRDSRVERIKDIRYAEGAGRRHLLDVWRPQRGVEGAPVLLQIHGGAWMVGDKGQQGLPLMLHLAAEGWVCVANNYRLSPRSRWPAHLVDCKLALRWVREHVAEYGGDPDFVVVTGGSAGGHLAAMVALTPGDPEYQPGFEDVDTSVRACIPFYGVYDLAETFAPPGTWTAGSEWMSRRVMDTTVAADPGAFERASPVNRITPDAPPFFVVHGTHDNLVSVEQARRFVAKLRATTSQPVCYAEVPGASHAFEVFHGVRTGNVVNAVDRFLAWLVSRDGQRVTRPPVSGNGADAVGGTTPIDPTTTARTAP